MKLEQQDYGSASGGGRPIKDQDPNEENKKNEHFMGCKVITDPTMKKGDWRMVYENGKRVIYSNPPVDIDPYEAQGKVCKHGFTSGAMATCSCTPKDRVFESNLRVHHPTQPKTQVERWEEEKEANIKVIVEHCGMWFAYRCTEHKKNFEKIKELELHISQDHEKNKTYLNRYPTGRFADDKQGTDWIDSLSEDMKKSIFGYNYNLKKKVTLLDKIKRLWKKK